MAFCLGNKTRCLKATVYCDYRKTIGFKKKITLNTSQCTHHKVRSDLNSAEKKAILLQKEKEKQQAIMILIQYANSSYAGIYKEISL